MRCSGRGARRGIPKRVRRSITGTTRAAVLDHAVDPLRKVGHCRRRAESQHALDREDVDCELVVAEAERDELLTTCCARCHASSGSARAPMRTSARASSTATSRFPSAPRRARLRHHASRPSAAAIVVTIRHDHILDLIDHQTNLPLAIAHDHEHFVRLRRALRPRECGSASEHGNAGAAIRQHAEQVRRRTPESA